MCCYFIIDSVRDMELLGKLLELIKVALESCQLRLSPMMPNTRHSHFNTSRRRMIKPIIKAKIQRLHKRIIAQYLVGQCDSQERVWTMKSETPECHLLVTGDWATHLISLGFCFPICQVGITTLARVILCS